MEVLPIIVQPKGELFKSLVGLKISILNHDDDNFDFFKNIPASQVYLFWLKPGADLEATRDKRSN